MLRGACYCGAVTYEVEDAFDYAAYCHCSRCRARTGSAFSTFAGIEAKKFRIVQGEELLTTLGDPRDAHNRFCSRCGSTLFSAFANGRMHVQMGTLIDMPTVRPGEHIFVGSNAEWHEIADGLPRYEGHRG